MKTKKPSITLLSRTVITIAPDGVITIFKTEETVTEQLLSKAE